MISITLIVKNERDRIGAWLDLVKGWPDIVIVDTGSTDGTWEMIPHGVQKIRCEGVMSFAKARNLASAHAHGEWVLWLDADMSFDRREFSKLDKRILDVPNDIDGLVLTLIDTSTGEARPFPSHRVIRQNIKFVGRVHEAPQCKNVWPDPFRITHHRPESPGQVRAKLAYYETLLREEMREEPANPQPYIYLRNLAFERGDFSEVRKLIRQKPVHDYMDDLTLARVCVKEGAFSEALDLGFVALKHCALDPRVPAFLADRLVTSDRLAEALVYTDMALSMPKHHQSLLPYPVENDEWRVVPWILKAQIYVKSECLGKAKEAYKMALQAQPSEARKALILKNLDALERTSGRILR